LCFFTSFYSFAVQETVTNPIVADSLHKYTDNIDWGVIGSYGLFSGSGVMSILIFIIYNYIGDRDDRYLALIGSVGTIIGWFMMIDYEERYINHVLFTIGYCIVSACVCFCRFVYFTMLSRIIGPFKAGSFMGLMLAVGAIARSAGPFLAVATLDVSIKLCFGFAAAFVLFGQIFLVICWNNCAKHVHFRTDSVSKKS